MNSQDLHEEKTMKKSIIELSVQRNSIKRYFIANLGATIATKGAAVYIKGSGSIQRSTKTGIKITKIILFQTKLAHRI